MTIQSRLSPVFLLFAALLASPAWAREPAPVIEAATEPGVRVSAFKQLAERLTRLEQVIKNQALVDMQLRLDTLQAENQQLTGQVEELVYQLEQLKKRQRELYLDTDRRLAALERSGGGAPAATTAAPLSSAPAASGAPEAATDVATAAGVSVAPAGTPSAPAAASPEEERADYERAFNLLKEGRYDLAIAAFKTFVQKYPQGRYSDNAQYWLGEANYVQRDFKAALMEFEKVVNNYPDSPKRPDALLKMGYTYQALGDTDKARLSLNSVLLNYPDSTAARLAQKRLQELKP